MKDTLAFIYSSLFDYYYFGVKNIKTNYIVFDDIETDYFVGVKQKIYNQSDVFNRKGFNSTVHVIAGKNIKEKIKLFKSMFSKNNNEIFIFRYFGVRLISLFNFIRIESKRNVFILEFPTPLHIWEKEIKTVYKNVFKIQLLILINRFIVPKIFKFFDVIIEYGSENARYTMNIEDKMVYINNGVNTESIPKKKIPINDKVIEFISVANISDWHGYDRLIIGMGEYYKNNPRVKVLYNCVGDGASVPYLKKLVNDLSLEEYVIFHGKKTGNDLDKLFDNSHVAFGSLAIHRLGSDIASTLKNREYCARGIPFVIASRDNGFPEDFKYSMQVSQDEKSINVNEIIDFYDSIKSSGYTTEMRKFAEENLTWDINLKPVFEKINKSAKFRHND